MQAKIQKLDNQFKEDVPQRLRDRYVYFCVLMISYVVVKVFFFIKT